MTIEDLLARRDARAFLQTPYFEQWQTALTKIGYQQAFISNTKSMKHPISKHWSTFTTLFTWDNTDKPEYWAAVDGTSVRHDCNTIKELYEVSEALSKLAYQKLIKQHPEILL